MKKIRAAAIQIAPDLNGANGTIDRMVQAIAEAADAGVKLAVFPETFVPYYPYFSFVEPPFASGKAHQKLYREAVEVPGPLAQRRTDHGNHAGSGQAKGAAGRMFLRNHRAGRIAFGRSHHRGRRHGDC